MAKSIREIKMAAQRAQRVEEDHGDEGFTCAYCGKVVTTEAAGTQHRNHCPHCLHSLHLDNEPGDRASDCKGDMEPIAVWVRDGGEWAILHRCKECGVIHSNRIAADDESLALMKLALKPVSNLPFPLEFLGRDGD